MLVYSGRLRRWDRSSRCALLCCFVLTAWHSVIAQLPDDAPNSTRPPAAALQLVLEPNGPAGTNSIDVAKPIILKLRNNSDQTAWVWASDWLGRHRITARIVNRRTDEAVEWKVGPPDEQEMRRLGLWGFYGLRRRLSAGKDVSLSVTLADLSAVVEGRPRLPEPNTPELFSVSFTYESLDSAPVPGKPLWTGSINSNEIQVTLTHSRLRIPNQYLEAGYWQRAIAILEAEPSRISQAESYLLTPLHVAAQTGSREATAWLLEHGAALSAVDQYDKTPLHYVTDPEVARLILARKPDVNARSDQRSGKLTPLASAARTVTEESAPERHEAARAVARLLIAAGAEYDLGSAIRLGDLARVREIYADPNQLEPATMHPSPLRLAASIGQVDVCRYLIDEHTVDLNEFKRGTGYPIIKESLSHPEVVRLLVASGADLQTRITWQGGRSGSGWIIGDQATALHFTTEQGPAASATALLDGGVDPFARTGTLSPSSTFGDQDQTALQLAAFYGRADIVQAIVEHPSFRSADPVLRQSQLDSALLIAPQWRAPLRMSRATLAIDPSECVQLLLAAGANPAFSFDGITPLGRAAISHSQYASEVQREMRGIARQLLVAGAKMDLSTAIRFGEQDKIRALLATQNDLASNKFPILPQTSLEGNEPRAQDARSLRGLIGSFPNPDGQLPLHLAVATEQCEATRILLDAGADPNVLDADQNSPLHLAVRLASPELVELLIKAGTNPQLRNIKRETAEDLAPNVWDEEARVLILQALRSQSAPQR